MFEYAVVFAAIIASLYLWGLVRTALWLIPALLIPDARILIAGIWMGFWAVSLWLSPYSDGAYEVRSLSKERKALVLFLSGILSGIFFYPAGLGFYVLGSAVPFLFLRIFKLFRHPISEVLFLPKILRWVFSILWLALLSLKIYESQI